MLRCFSKAASCVHENWGKGQHLTSCFVFYVARALRPRHITSVTWAPKPPAADRGDVIVIAGLEFGGDSKSSADRGIVAAGAQETGLGVFRTRVSGARRRGSVKRLARKGNLSGLHGDPEQFTA